MMVNPAGNKISLPQTQNAQNKEVTAVISKQLLKTRKEMDHSFELLKLSVKALYQS